jgi:hypothetical protein
MMSRRISALCAAALSVLLSGCFNSDVEKFPPASAVAPFGEGGSYDLFERGDGDHYTLREAFEVRRRSDGGYDFVSATGDVQPISFYPLAGGDFIGQARAEKDRKGYVFTVFRVRADGVFFYLPQCDGQDQAKLATFGVVVTSRFECSIDGVADPAGLFATLELGQPVSKMVRR